MRLGAMQDFPLRIMRILDHAEREHGAREIVAARADGSIHRTNWTEMTDRSRRLARALERLCYEATLAVEAGHNILILSDRATSAERVPIPALLATSAVSAVASCADLPKNSTV